MRKKISSPIHMSGTISHQDIYQKIHLVAGECHARVYLVGGWVRNQMLQRNILDFDLLVYGTESFMHTLHQKVPSTLICLDKERRIYRLALKKSPLTIDITFEDEQVPLSQNLSERDFTINAMAIKCEDIVNPGGSLIDLMIDPFCGRQDVEKGIIRMVKKENLLNDPLRLCRAFRFGAEYGFKIHKDTLDAIADHASLILEVAPERIHEEWIKMMKSDNTAIYIKQMKETGLLGEIFPEIKGMEGLDQGRRHTLTLWEHSWTALFYLEAFINKPGKYFISGLKKLARDIKQNCHDQLPYLKMAALFHDIGKPKVKGIGKKGQVTFYRHQKEGAVLLQSRMESLRFSRAEIRLTTKLVQDHMRPLLLSQTESLSDRARARLFIHLAETWQALLLLSVADMFATGATGEYMHRYMNFINSLLLFRKRMEKNIEKAPLITGNDLKEELHFPPGPMMGKVLQMVNQSFLGGMIKTKAEAFDLARKFLKR